MKRPIAGLVALGVLALASRAPRAPPGPPPPPVNTGPTREFAGGIVDGQGIAGPWRTTAPDYLAGAIHVPVALHRTRPATTTIGV